MLLNVKGRSWDVPSRVFLRLYGLEKVESVHKMLICLVLERFKDALVDRNGPEIVRNDIGKTNGLAKHSM